VVSEETLICFDFGELWIQPTQKIYVQPEFSWKTYLAHILLMQSGSM